jgi:hypothetical protein
MIDTERDELTADDYRAALASQTAPNLAAIVASLSSIMSRIWNEAHRRQLGTDWVNTHPICRLFAAQIEHLTAARGYASANLLCEQFRDAMADPINLDCIDETELRTYAADQSKPAELRDYAHNKAKAMAARLAGQIDTALRHERVCEQTYKKLPKGLQW